MPPGLRESHITDLALRLSDGDCPTGRGGLQHLYAVPERLQWQWGVLPGCLLLLLQLPLLILLH